LFYLNVNNLIHYSFLIKILLIFLNFINENINKLGMVKILFLLILNVVVSFSYSRRIKKKFKSNTYEQCDESNPCRISSQSCCTLEGSDQYVCQVECGPQSLCIYTCGTNYLDCRPTKYSDQTGAEHDGPKSCQPIPSNINNSMKNTDGKLFEDTSNYRNSWKK
jgi:hypothetical protein